MTTDTAIDEAIQRNGRIKPSHGYWRKANGEITVSVNSEMEELAYRREGWTPLFSYGFFDMSSSYTANHPFELLFMKGGAAELPVQQVIDLGFHINPPTVPNCGIGIGQGHATHGAGCWRNPRVVTFPQLEGSDAHAWPCRFCDEVRGTEAGRNNHEIVAHKDERGELRSGAVLADNLVTGLTKALQGAQQPVAAPAGGQEVLDVLVGVGLNKAQLKALVDAGLIPAEAASD